MNDNSRGEYLLTDVIGTLRGMHLRVTGVLGPSQDFQSVELTGRFDYGKAEARHRRVHPGAARKPPAGATDR